MPWLQKSSLPLLFAAFLLLSGARKLNAQPSKPDHPEAHQVKDTGDQQYERPEPVAAIHNQKGSESTPQKTKDRPYRDPPESPPVPFQEITTVLLIVFTGGLWATSIWQWLAIRKQADIAEKGAEAAKEALRFEQRPWLVPIGVQFSTPGGEIRDWERLPIRIDLKNTGNTPALQVTVTWAHDEIREWFEPMPEDEPFRYGTANIGAIGPGVTHSVSAIIGPFPGPNPEHIREGTFRLTVRGRIEYRDHASMTTPPVKPYTTKFCVAWFPRLVAPEARFVIMGPYNDCT